MANSLKESGGGLALQVTGPARDAGLVKEDADGEVERLSGVYVYGFDGLLVVVDAERVSTAERAEIVSTATEATGSIHRGGAATVEVAGNGYQVQLPGAESAGFDVGDTAPVVLSDGLLVIHGDADREIVDLVSTVRDDQLV